MQSVLFRVGRGAVLALVFMSLGLACTTLTEPSETRVVKEEKPMKIVQGAGGASAKAAVPDTGKAPAPGTMPAPQRPTAAASPSASAAPSGSAKPASSGSAKPAATANAPKLGTTAAPKPGTTAPKAKAPSGGDPY
jgi:preprotein translocase subunit SecD